MQTLEDAKDWKNRFLTSMELLQQQLILLKDTKLTVDIALCVVCSVKQIMQLSVQTVTFERYYLESVVLKDLDNKSTTVDELIKYMQSDADSSMFDIHHRFNLQEIVSKNRDAVKNVCHVDDNDDMGSEGDESVDIDNTFDNRQDSEPSLKLKTDVSNLGSEGKDWEDGLVGEEKNQNLHDYKICDKDIKYNLRSCSVVLSPGDVARYRTSRLVECETHKKMEKNKANGDFKINSKKRKLSTDVDIVKLRGVKRKRKTSDILTNKYHLWNDVKDIEDHLRDAPRWNPDQRITWSLNFLSFRCYLCETGEEFRNFRSLASHVRSEHCKSGDSPDKFILCCPESINGCLFNIEFDIYLKREILSTLLGHMYRNHQIPFPGYIILFRCKYCMYQNHKFFLFEKHIANHLPRIGRKDCGEKIGPLFFQKQREEFCRNSRLSVAYPSRKNDAKQLFCLSNSDNDVHENILDCIGSSVKNEIASRNCVDIVENTGEKLKNLPKDLANKEILLANGDNSDLAINSCDSASQCSNSGIELTKTALEMQHRVSSQVVESSNQVAGFLESETDYICLTKFNFTTFKCFICNIDRVYRRLAFLIKHVISAHCHSSETSDDLKITCFVDKCEWQKPVRRWLALSPLARQKIRFHIEAKLKYSLLLKHLVSDHKMSVPDYIKSICCTYPQCGFKCLSLISLRRHAKKHDEKVYCEYCERYFTLDYISKHLKKCLPENFETENQSPRGIPKATSSQNISDDSLKPNREIIKANELNEIDARRRKLLRWVYQQLELELNTKLSRKYLNFISFECYLCDNGNSFLSYNFLCDHLAEKHFQEGSNGELIISCPKSHESCTWERRFKRNLQEFKQSYSNLLKHLNIEHDVAFPACVRRFQCMIPRCPMEYVDVRNLTLHMATHDTEKVTCECGRFVKALRIRDHMKVCHTLNRSKHKQVLVTKESQSESSKSSNQISKDGCDGSLKNHRGMSENEFDMQEDISVASLVDTFDVKPNLVFETSPTATKHSFASENSPFRDVMPTFANETPARQATVAENTGIEMEQESIVATEVEKEAKSKKRKPGSNTLSSAVESSSKSSVNIDETGSKDGRLGYSKYALIGKENENTTLRFKCYRCFICVESKIEYRSYRLLCTHFRQEHCIIRVDKQIQWQCSFCKHQKKIYYDAIGRKKLMQIFGHLKSKHNFEVPSYLDQFDCKEPGCGSKFLSRYYLNSHQNAHDSTRSPCEHCGKLFTLNCVKGHSKICSERIEKKRVRIKCNHCDKQFTTKKILQMHMKSKHGESQDHKMMCEMCTASFHTRSDLERHSWHIHKLNISDRPLLQCPKCPRQFMQKSKLAQHTEIHTEGKSFVCETCQKGFNTKRKLRIHVDGTHGEQRFRCTKCEFVATRSANLRQHNIAQHTTVKYTCEICGYATGYFANLCKHKKQSSFCREKLQGSSTSKKC